MIALSIEGIQTAVQKIFADPSKEILILTLAGWSAGISLYLTVGLLGLCGHFEWIHLPGELAVFAHPIVFSFAFIIFSIEFIADKVPYVDSVWDSVHTFVRPVGGIAIGYLAGSEHGPMIQTMYAMFAGTLTLNTHTAKAAERLAINTSPEPFSNIAASTVEQGLVIFLYWFFIRHPVWTCVIITALLVIAFFLIRFWFWKVPFKGKEPMILSLNGKQESIEKPLSLAALVQAKGLSPDRIVVEHNLCIISKEDWPKIMLKDQDMVEIVSFVGGG